ncbi:MAG TPA: putative toxin-antitoxin system toxin component, PIN family [Campylobacterales bacterium]|nr:putative toxin-antitoxin system toxin component, PIN family [Campylobacterales bacterium]
MKIVIDANVILSALFSQNGASNRLLIWLFSQKKNYNVISNTLVTEFEDILTRDKNMKKFANLSREDIESFIDDICLISFYQKINFLWRPFLKDQKDDMVLEVAFNAGADVIVTGNIKDFKNVTKHFGIKILTPQEFLKQLGELS